MLIIKIVSFFTFTVHADTVHAEKSFEVLLIGWTPKCLLDLMYRHNLGLEFTGRSFGWWMIRCHPLFSFRRLLCEFISGSLIARIRTLAMLGWLKREYTTSGDWQKFSWKIANKSGDFDVLMGCAIIEQPLSWLHLHLYQRLNLVGLINCHRGVAAPGAWVDWAGIGFKFFLPLAIFSANQVGHVE